MRRCAEVGESEAYSGRVSKPVSWEMRLGRQCGTRFQVLCKE